VDAHRRAGSVLTIATHERLVEIDYGVLHADESDRVVAYDEKPTLSYTVSMGVYVLEPEARSHVPADRPFDLPDLVQALLRSGEAVGSFPYDGYWLDIGRRDDYERAISEFEARRAELLPAD